MVIPRATLLAGGGLLAALIAAAAWPPVSHEERVMVQQSTPVAARRPTEGELSSLSRATLWLNSEPLTASGLRGKVVLVEFGTYTCINWLRTLPVSAPGPRNTGIRDSW